MLHAFPNYLDPFGNFFVFYLLQTRATCANLRTIQFSAHDAQWSPSMSHRRLPPWLPRAHRHARPRPHDATYHPRPSASPRLRKWSCFTVPPRAHPSTSSQSGSATPGLTTSNTSTEYSLPGATQLSQVRSISPSGQGVPCRFLPCTVSQSVTSQSVNQSVISQFSRCNVPIRLVKIENSIIQKCLHADALNSFSGDAGRHRPCDNMICRYYMIMNM